MESGPASFVPDYYNATFNPSDIVLTYESIFSLDTTITFQELQDWVESKFKFIIIYGTRIGAASVALLVLTIVTKNKKSPIFVINIMSLLFIILQSGVYLKYLKSNYTSITYSFTYFEQIVKRSDIYTTGAANMLEVILIFCVEISLVFQVYTIFKSTESRYLGKACILFSVCLGLATVALYFASAIKNMIAVYHNIGSTGDEHLYNAAIICLASSINFMTVLLCFKLMHAIKSRRFLGLKQFDTFHILLIMTSQSLIIPSILYILAYALPTHDGTQSLQAISTLIIVLSLPLSSMWAGASNSTSNTNTFNPNFTVNSKFDQRSFYSQGLNSAIHSRRGKEKNVGFDEYSNAVIGEDDIGSNISSYLNHAVETPLDAGLNPALQSALPEEDIDAAFQQYMLQQSSSASNSHDDKLVHVKTISKR